MAMGSDLPKSTMRWDKKRLGGEAHTASIHTLNISTIEELDLKNTLIWKGG